MPRHLPLYVQGLFATPRDPNPAAVNNVETLCNVPSIVEWGSDWFRSVGTETSPGTMLFTVVGDAQRPGLYELPLGTPLSRLLFDLAGARLPNTAPSAYFPAHGTLVVVPERFDVPRLRVDVSGGIGVGVRRTGRLR